MNYFDSGSESGSLMIQYYFDIIPQELTHVILYNIDDINVIKNLYNSLDLMKNILLDHKFWNAKIRQNMPEVDLDFVPNYLYNYQGKSLDIILANYSLIYRCYNKVMKIIKYVYGRIIEIGKLNDGDIIYVDHYSEKYMLALVNNFEVLKAHKSSSGGELLERFLKGDFSETARSSIEILFYDDKIYKININFWSHHFTNNITYIVTLRDALNLYMHIQCNGGIMSVY